MDEIQGIVEALSSPPFNQRMTLVEFHAKRPVELLQIVNDVFTVIDSKQKRDVRTEQEDECAVRMIDFLVILNYKHNMDLVTFKDKFMGGDPSVIYPLLGWIMSRIDHLKKRSYIATYLRNVDVPEEFFADDIIVGQYQKYKELQVEFKEIHTDLEKANPPNPGALQDEISQLEVEREQLVTKMDRLSNKIENHTDYSHMDFKELLDATQSLRKEQEEESRLVDSLNEQKNEYYASEQRHRQLALQLDELRARRANADPMQQLHDLRQEVNRMRDRVEFEIDREIRDREDTLRNFDSVLSSEPMTAADISDLERQIEDLSGDVENLTAKRDQAHSAVDGKVGFYRDRATAVEKKRDRLMEQVSELETEKQETELELQALSGELEKYLINGQKPKSEAEMKQYISDLTSKTNVYKQYKAELQSLWNETRVLQNTELTLRARDDNIKEFNLHEEKRRGVMGALDTQDQLEQVSAEKSKVDASKGSALDEMSEIVDNITRTLKSRKATLAPKIKELRETRAEFQTHEKVYLEKKRQYENTNVGLEAERIKLEQDVEGNVKAIQSEESSYHFISALQQLTRAKQNMLERELSHAVGERQATSECRTYQEVYERTIHRKEERAKELRRKQKQVKESHTDHVQQRKKFWDLQKLLTIKLESQNRVVQEQRREEQGLMDFGGEAGVERMTFD